MGFEHLAYQAPRQGGGGIYRVTGIEHERGIGRPGAPGEECGHSPTANPAELDLRRGERGSLRRQPDVRGHRQLEATAKGIAVHGGDDWLADRPDGVAVVWTTAELPRRVVGVQFADIAASAECLLASASEDHHPDRALGIDAVRVTADRIGHARRDGVKLRWPVKGQGCYRPGDVEKDVGEFFHHCCHLTISKAPMTWRSMVQSSRSRRPGGKAA